MAEKKSKLKIKDEYINKLETSLDEFKDFFKNKIKKRFRNKKKINKLCRTLNKHVKKQKEIIGTFKYNCFNLHGLEK